MLHRRMGACLLPVVLLFAFQAGAEVYTFSTPARWSSWTIPSGVVKLTPDGQLQLTRYRKGINAVADAHLFSQPTQKRGVVQGGIWRAGSSSSTAARILDGDPQSAWKPNQADPLVDWFVDIDLGRPVLADTLRLVFADGEGGRPFRQFSVFTSTGARIQSTDDVFKYSLSFRTTKPNFAARIDIPLVGNLDTARVVDAGLDVDLEGLNSFRMVRFVRIVADEKSPDAALADLEVIAAGDNISLGVLERGGSFGNGLLAREPQNMFDGITDTYGNIFTVATKGGWKESGVWWEVDLGALFWIDEAFVYWQDRGEGQSSFLFEGLQAGTGYETLFSDGRRTISGDIDYTPLIFEPAPVSSRERSLRHFRYLFQPRKIRYLFWHSLTDQGWFSHPMEFMLFSPGYPAQVTLRSGFIDLGQIAGDGRPKAIKSLTWEADTPPQTKLQLRSRSGNNLAEVYTFHDRKGEVITELKWTSSPKVLRGPVDTTLVVGADWGQWSNFYQFSGESFQSETPRRFVQLELLMSTEDPQAAPQMRSLSIEFEEALVQGARGRILPRQAEPNVDTRFTYALWPSADARDSGFDRLRLAVPSAVDPDGVGLRVGGVAAPPEAVRVEGDSLLFVDLPERVVADSIQVEFSTRVLHNATVFSADLGSSERPGLWQSVEAAGRRDNIVFLPDLVGSDRLIGDLEVVPSAFTPNGDGINDLLEIRFVLYKVQEKEPRVRIFDLSGRQIAELQSASPGTLKNYTWSGADAGGGRVRPGIYLLHIDADAEAGDGTVVRTISVAY